jgi:glycosyltransferase involved in cell wall biosynthesis
VISTTIGAEGLPTEPMLIADHPADFARAIECILEDDETGRKLGAQGRRLYEERLTWPAAWGRLRDWGL